MANNEKELYKFVNDPKYRESILNSVRRKEDYAYNKQIRDIRESRNFLDKERTSEITRIASSRWQKIAGGRILVNRTEGKIKINNSVALFSDIRGAELNIVNGARVVTTEQSKSKKHASLGGAVAGAMVLGPVGAVVGGVGLGKTKTKGNAISNQVPTCMHLGVLVNINGFVSEIVLQASQVDLSSPLYRKAYSDAQIIISQLSALANTPVPSTYTRPEDEESVRLIDSKIAQKDNELREAEASTPNYAIPLTYRTQEQMEMSDEEYLEYLKGADIARIEKEKALKEERARQKAIEKETKKAERKQKAQSKAENGASNYEHRESKLADNTILQKSMTVGSLLAKILFWAISVMFFLFSLIFFICEAFLSGIIFLVTALIANPLIRQYLVAKKIKIPIWVVILAIIIGFFAGILNFPID